ncbi:MAG: ABC transporter permease [Deltaproteobacteria bacterium]|nr:ABC transporter permease [Deltaproteobacteria bacterium]
MFKNYFKIAFRNLIKQKSWTLISLFSLAVGITCFMLLMLYSRYELSYDSFFKHSDRIFQLGQYLPDWKHGGSNYFASTSGIVAPTLKEEFPDVAYAVRTKEVKSPLIYREKSILGRGLYADRDFLKVFTFPVITGDSDTALKDPFSIVLSQSLSEKLFGSEDPIGKIITYQNGRVLKVTGIVEDIPGNTHLKFDYLISFLTMYSLRDDIDSSWGILNYNSYIQLKDKVSYLDFEKKLPAIVSKYHDRNSNNRRYFLIPLQNIHFETHVNFHISDIIDKKSIYLLISIAFLILIISCINYVNLATARAGARNKEVGIRKTVGATERQLRKQFLGESFVLTFFSILVSLGTACLLFPVFRHIAGSAIPMSIFLSWANAAGLMVLFLIVGFLSGAYPAFYLSAFKPLNVLKNTFGSSRSGDRLRFRNILLVFQFGVTVVLLVSAVTIQKQLLFIKNQDIGYNRDNVVTVRIWNKESRENFQTIKRELLKNPQISAAAVANTTPLILTEANDIQVETETGEMMELPMVTTYFIDEDYVDLFNMKITAGRNFSLNLNADIENQVILNETAARIAGLEEPVGKRINKWGQNMRIIGVVDDFHFTSFRSEIKPLMFQYIPERSHVFLVKIGSDDMRKTLGYINSTFRRFSPNFTFDYALMDDLYLNLYKREGDLGRIILSFSILTMIIAAIGLYGLISFVVRKKTKEIGIRKVLGASVFSVTSLILKQFFMPIALAVMISLPVAYYLSHEWLEGFVYRIGLNVGLFAFSIAVILIVAVLSIGRQTIRAALANPSHTLKHE